MISEIAIRARYDLAPHDLAAIADDFAISVSHVCGIGKRRFWKHLPEDPVFYEASELNRLSKLENPAMS